MIQFKQAKGENLDPAERKPLPGRGRTGHLFAGLCCLATWCTGCAEPVGEDAPQEVASSSIPLALLVLSDTRIVTFHEDPAAGVVLVSETLNVDRDLNGDGPPLLNHIRDVATLQDIYLKLTQGRSEQSVLDTLAAADARILETSRRVPVPTDEEIAVDTVLEPVEGDRMEKPAKISQAVCSEPAWDWPGDESWFLTNFCGVGYQYCDSLDAAHTYGRKSKHFLATSFAQSHCSTTTHRLSYSYTDCNPWPFCSGIAGHFTPSELQPRTLTTQHAVGNVQYRVYTASTQGNFSGLAAFSWN